MAGEQQQRDRAPAGARRRVTPGAAFATVLSTVLGLVLALPAAAPATASTAPATASTSAAPSSAEADAAARTASAASVRAGAAAEQARSAAEAAARRATEAHEALAHQEAVVGQRALAAVNAQVEADQRRAHASAASAASAARARALYIDPTRGLADEYTFVRSLLADPAAATHARDLSRHRSLAAAARSGAARAVQVAADADAADADAARADQLAVDTVAAVRDLAARSSALHQALEQAQERLSALDAQASQLRAAQEAAQAIAAARAAAESVDTAAAHSTASARAGTAPTDYAQLYRSAATTCPGMRPALLQAVGQVESGHGRNVGPSSAGAVGPMQFMPATFAAYAVDGDGDGDADAWDPADSVFTAARYLCSNGAGKGREAEAKALFRYNHADWYVEMVQRIADEIDAASTAAS